MGSYYWLKTTGSLDSLKEKNPIIYCGLVKLQYWVYESRKELKIDWQKGLKSWNLTNAKCRNFGSPCFISWHHFL